jgi:hypothetical protein
MKPYKKKFKEELNNKKIIITCRDRDNNLEDLLEYIQSIGNGGHSFEIIVDPTTSNYTKTFYWDGDGSDRIEGITVERMEEK